MPKDEFDFDDPLELNGVALSTDVDTSRDMAECFVEEFLMLGYNHKQLLALFRNPHYLGMNMLLQNQGEPFVQEVIRDVLARWGKKIDWSKAALEPSPACGRQEGQGGDARGIAGDSAQPAQSGSASAECLTDPLGNPVPKLNL